MSYTKDLVIDAMNEIDDEETRDSLFRLRAILLAKNDELANIAEKCSTFLEFQKIIKDWFKNDEVSISRRELSTVWDLVQKVDDLVNMRKED